MKQHDPDPKPDLDPCKPLTDLIEEAQNPGSGTLTGTVKLL
jgi:hypothetical protein